METLGATENMLYDILSPPGIQDSVQPVKVNSTTFDVTCGSLPEAQQTKTCFNNNSMDVACGAYIENGTEIGFSSTAQYIFNLGASSNLSVAITPNRAYHIATLSICVLRQ